MTLNDVLMKSNVVTQILLENGNKELSKKLKVKIMRIRMAYSKIKKTFDEEVKEFTEQLITDEFRDLSNKTDKTPEEVKLFEELTQKFNSEYQEFLIQKGNEIVNDIEDTLTEEEYSDIVDVNSGNSVEINGNQIKATDFLEIIYELFVKE